MSRLQRARLDGKRFGCSFIAWRGYDACRAETRHLVTLTQRTGELLICYIDATPLNRTAGVDLYGDIRRGLQKLCDAVLEDTIINWAGN